MCDGCVNDNGSVAVIESEPANPAANLEPRTEGQGDLTRAVLSLGEAKVTVNVGAAKPGAVIEVGPQRLAYDPLHNPEDLIVTPDAFRYLNEYHPVHSDEQPGPLQTLSWHLTIHDHLVHYAVALDRPVTREEVMLLVGFAEPGTPVLCSNSLCNRPFVPVWRIEPWRNPKFMQLIKECGDIATALKLAEEQDVAVVTYGAYFMKVGGRWDNPNDYVPVCGQPYCCKGRFVTEFVMDGPKGSCVGRLFRILRDVVNKASNTAAGRRQEWGFSLQEVHARIERDARRRALKASEKAAREEAMRAQEAEARAANDAALLAVIGLSPESLKPAALREATIVPSSARAGAGVVKGKGGKKSQ